MLSENNSNFSNWPTNLVGTTASFDSQKFFQAIEEQINCIGNRIKERKYNLKDLNNKLFGEEDEKENDVPIRNETVAVKRIMQLLTFLESDTDQLTHEIFRLRELI